MLIRILGALCLALGTLVVTHDLTTIYVYGEPDASLLAELLAFARWSGRGEWQAILMWMLPMWMGVAMFFIDALNYLAASRSRRSLPAGNLSRL